MKLKIIAKDKICFDDFKQPTKTILLNIDDISTVSELNHWNMHYQGEVVDTDYFEVRLRSQQTLFCPITEYYKFLE